MPQAYLVEWGEGAPRNNLVLCTSLFVQNMGMSNQKGVTMIKRFRLAWC